MSFGFIAGSIFGISIRTVQILFALLTWALAADAINTYPHVGSMAWLLVCGLISFIYAIGVLVLSFVLPGLIVPGAIIIMESICALFNFTGFIAAAADWGSGSCSGDIYTGFVIIHYNFTACKAGKAAIAFGAFNWFLFSITAIIFGIYSLKPLIADRASWWGTGAKFSVGVLTLKSSGSAKSDTPAPIDEEATVGDSPIEKGEEDVVPETTQHTE